MAKERGSGTALFVSRCIAKFYNLSQRVCTSALVLARVNERWEREWSSFFGSGMGHFWFISLCCFSSSARCFTLCFAGRTSRRWSPKPESCNPQGTLQGSSFHLPPCPGSPWASPTCSSAPPKGCLTLGSPPHPGRKPSSVAGAALEGS